LTSAKKIDIGINTFLPPFNIVKPQIGWKERKIIMRADKEFQNFEKLIRNFKILRS
jgi:hypothetical protein